MSSKILLKGGTLLIHNEDEHVEARKMDLLVEGETIARISEQIDPSPSMQVIECNGKIISAGFIDTHHHLWQTQLKTKHADQSLLDYFYSGNFTSTFFTPHDMFWGQLSGALECIDAGTTTVVDHAHLNYSPAHTQQAIIATVASGIRSIFCYCPTPQVATWKPEFQLNYDLLPDWVMLTFEDLARQTSFGPGGRVRLGFAFDGLFLPGEVLKALFARVRSAGVQLITLHSVHCAMFGNTFSASVATKLSELGLLASDILLAHHNNPTPEDTRLILDARAHISSTPTTELQMAHGNPVCLTSDLAPNASLGVDCHSACNASIPTQMMLALQFARGRRHEEFEAKGEWSEGTGFTVEQVYNLGTIQGAKAVGMDKEVGSLRVGKRADLVVFRGDSPSMLAATERDPVAAVVLHSSIRDVDTVIINGVIRKESGELKVVSVPEDLHSTSDVEGRPVTWMDIVKEVKKSSADVEQRISETVDVKAAKEGIMRVFYMNQAGFIDNS